MKEVIVLVTFVYCIRMGWTTALKSNPAFQKSSSPDCSKYKTDYEIILSFQFPVDFNPWSQDFGKAHALTNDTIRINYLNINDGKFLPPSVFCLKYLKQLHIRNTNFSNYNYQLPADIERLAPTLTALRIYKSKVTHLPEQISKLKQLETLELATTNLVVLPNSIGNLTSLTRLSLPNNKLTSLPETIKNLKLLESIELKNNPSLRSIEYLNGLPNLKYIDTSNCPIQYIPTNLPQLADLYMSKNNLSNLFGIQTLGFKTNNSKSLYFNHNFIRSISPEIQNVRSLSWLNLDNNYLTDLPRDIFDVATLTHLYIRNNNFTNYVLTRIIAKFNVTHPQLNLYYSMKKNSIKKNARN